MVVALVCCGIQIRVGFEVGVIRSSTFDDMVVELVCSGSRIGVGVVPGVMVGISRMWICSAMVLVLCCGEICAWVEVGSVVSRWRVFMGVVEAHVCLRCFLGALVLNFKIRKYFNNNLTYVRRVTAHTYAFTYNCLRENVEIIAFILATYVNVIFLHSHSATYL